MPQVKMNLVYFDIKTEKGSIMPVMCPRIHLGICELLQSPAHPVSSLSEQSFLFIY